MSRIIQVYDEEKQINTQVSRFKQSTDVLSPSTEALRNVFTVHLRGLMRSILNFRNYTAHREAVCLIVAERKKNKKVSPLVFVNDIRGLEVHSGRRGSSTWLLLYLCKTSTNIRIYLMMWLAVCADVRCRDCAVWSQWRVFSMLFF